MAENPNKITQIQVGGVTYDICDSTARSSIHDQLMYYESKRSCSAAAQAANSFSDYDPNFASINTDDASWTYGSDNTKQGYIRGQRWGKIVTLRFRIRCTWNVSIPKITNSNPGGSVEDTHLATINDTNYLPYVDIPWVWNEYCWLGHIGASTEGYIPQGGISLDYIPGALADRTLTSTAGLYSTVTYISRSATDLVIADTDLED